MKKISVTSRSGNYSVLIGRDLLSSVPKLMAVLGLNRKVMIVVQKRVARLHLSKLLKPLKASGFNAYHHEIPDGEKAKSQNELFRLFENLLDRRFERKDSLIALGGGVAGDLTGFAAATYLRGIPFINIPTTLLAQVDSSIGGKTGINLKEGKNLAGAFYPPRLVISDVNLMKTLPKSEITSAMGEIVKYGMIRDVKIFEVLEKNTVKVNRGDSRLLEKLIVASAAIKADVVSNDEFETKGERMILNFGHTFGHGFEQALNYKKLKHGEAVALGMVCAARLARRLKLFSENEERRLLALLKKLHLPLSLAPYRLKSEKILSAMMRDKKNKGGQIRFVLPVKIGRVKIVSDVPLPRAAQILRELGAN